MNFDHLFAVSFVIIIRTSNQFLYQFPGGSEVVNFCVYVRSMVVKLIKMFKNLILLSILCTSLAIPDLRQDSSPWSLGGSMGMGSVKGKFGFGTCPKIDPVEDFDINGILGTWYIHYHHEPMAATFKCGKWMVSLPENGTKGTPYRFRIDASAIDGSTGEWKELLSSNMFVEIMETGDKDGTRLKITKTTPGKLKYCQDKFVVIPEHAKCTFQFTFVFLIPG